MKRKFKLIAGLYPNRKTYNNLDRLFVPMDLKHIRRTKNIRLIPIEKYRRGGKYSFAEWAHVIGIFQTLMLIHLNNVKNNYILDVGCGTGILAIASEPFLETSGHYIGIDVNREDIEFCNSYYPSQKYSFIHLDVNNPCYSPNQNIKRVNWDVESGIFDLVTGLSVWTHFNEDDAMFYIKEVNRVLKSGGKAIITFFLLDEIYDNSLSIRSSEEGRYHMTNQLLWTFDQKAYNSDNWFCPKWTKIPENAIGIDNRGFERLIAQTELRKLLHYQGNWKEIPGIFFQDVVIFQKT